MPALRERDLGVLEGLTTDEMRESQPRAISIIYGRWSKVTNPVEKVSNSFLIVVLLLLRPWPMSILGKKVVAVTHGGVLGAVFRKVLKSLLKLKETFFCLIVRLTGYKSRKLIGILSVGEMSHI